MILLVVKYVWEKLVT